MIEIVAATKNAGKIAEIAAALGSLNFVVRSVNDYGEIAEPEETGQTFKENAILKALYYASKTGKPCLADDSGLEVDGLNGAPGVYSARYAGPDATDAANNHKLLTQLAQQPDSKRTARFRCVLAFCDTQGAMLTADGTCEGMIMETARGSGGFGYDPLFYMPPYNKTLAEMSVTEKNAVSHRGKALVAMAAKLQEYGRC